MNGFIKNNMGHFKHVTEYVDLLQKGFLEKIVYPDYVKVHSKFYPNVSITKMKFYRFPMGYVFGFSSQHF